MARKRILLFSFSILFVGLSALSAAIWLSLESAVRHRAVSAPREAFREADRFEILYLGKEAIEDASQSFSVSRSRPNYRVVAREKLPEGLGEELKKLMSELYLTKEYSVMCHAPHHAIRAFDGSKLIFEATLCLECTNMDFLAFGLFPVEVTLVDREASGMDLPKLAEFLERVRSR